MDDILYKFDDISILKWLHFIYKIMHIIPSLLIRAFKNGNNLQKVTWMKI